jgi:hypothetical protein
MPSKKTAKPAPARKRAGGKKRIGLTSALGPKATTALVICVLGGGLALGSYEKEQASSKTPPSETVLASDAAVLPPTSTPMKKTAKTSATATGTTGSSDSASAPKVDATVSGCLERAGDTFRLKDTMGEDAPKSRSWKSGFMKKGAAPITVVDPSRSLRLGSHVGRRVSVSGTLANRELRADAIHAVASSCKAN